MINVSFDALEDADERRYFKQLPTSFYLKDEDVDRLREVGRRLLRDSPEFQRLLKALK
jgi:NTE family protein